MLRSSASVAANQCHPFARAEKSHRARCKTWQSADKYRRETTRDQHADKPFSKNTQSSGTTSCSPGPLTGCILRFSCFRQGQGLAYGPTHRQGLSGRLWSKANANQQHNSKGASLRPKGPHNSVGFVTIRPAPGPGGSSKAFQQELLTMR
jgi:hypothetical protein